MRKLLLILLVLLIAFPNIGFAAKRGIYTTVASGTVTGANITVTLTNGSADVDLSSATIPRNYKGHLLKIYDANNVLIQGYVYTNGTGTVQNIVSTKGGTTRNWTTKGAGFDDTTNCRYEIVKVNNTVAVVDSNTTAANEHVSLVDGNAFYFGSIDMTNYQDGRHYLWMKDSSGYVAFAKIKAEVPSGEALGSEKNTAWTNYGSGYDYETLTINANGHDIDSAINSTGSAECDSSLGTVSTGSLWKSTIGMTVNSGQSPSYLVSRSKGGGSTNQILATLGTGNYTYYFTTHIGTAQWEAFQNTTNSNIAVTKSTKQVTECAATGAHLMNAAGTRNMIYQHPSFNGNAISNIKILYFGD